MSNPRVNREFNPVKLSSRGHAVRAFTANRYGSSIVTRKLYIGVCTECYRSYPVKWDSFICKQLAIQRDAMWMLRPYDCPYCRYQIIVRGSLAEMRRNPYLGEILHYRIDLVVDLKSLLLSSVYRSILYGTRILNQLDLPVDG